MNVIFCELKNPKHKLPMADRGGRFFGGDGEWVDSEHPFYRLCIEQGDIVENEARGEKLKAEAKPVTKKAKAPKSPNEEFKS